MILLSNGCRYSGAKVIPKSWKTSTSTRKPWLVYYRFYDPAHLERYPAGQLVSERGMNVYKDVNHRREWTRAVLAVIKNDIEVEDYNPMTGYKKEITAPKTDYEIDPSTPLLEALKKATDKKKARKSVKDNMRSVLTYINIAAKNIHIDTMPVKDVRRRHIKSLLEQCGVIKDIWSANAYNHYRSYLMMMFDELCEWEAIQDNPIDKRLKKMKHAVQKRATLTPEQRIAIDAGLKKDDYILWRFMHLFFHSGARLTEMMRIKKPHVNLSRQVILYTILKGKQYKQEERPITNEAIELWREAIKGAGPDDYIFSRNLTPGKSSIRPERITKLWKKAVKDKIDEEGNPVYGEVADFYSLKHTHSTEVAAKVGTRLAALHNRHTEAVMKQSYDVQGEARDMEIMKGIVVPFAPRQESHLA